MFSHVMVGSNDLDRAQHFYDAIFAAIGGRAGHRDEHGITYRHERAVFMVRLPLDGRTATHGNGSTIGFNIGSAQLVRAWHAAGVDAGGTAIEDAPGVRKNAFGSLYLAYLRDPDGNKLCALHSLPGD